MNDESRDAEIASLRVNVCQLEHRVRYLEKLIDTRNSAWYRRLKWRLIDGFPPWYRLGPPKRRWFV